MLLDRITVLEQVRSSLDLASFSLLDLAHCCSDLQLVVLLPSSALHQMDQNHVNLKFRYCNPGHFKMG